MSSSVSPSVVAMYVGERVEPGMERLQLLVLWRGEPGWYARTGGGASGGSGGTADGGVRVRHSQGGVELEATVDARTESVTVAGQTFDLRRSNVILVDGTGGQPTVVGTLGVQTLVAVPPAAAHLERIVNVFALPDIKAFLRCDLQPATRVAVSNRMC